MPASLGDRTGPVSGEPMDWTLSGDEESPGEFNAVAYPCSS
jgi:hypothetical protein